MSVLILGLDGLDYNHVVHRRLLGSLSPSHLNQDLTGANGLYTYRVWPAIFSGSDPVASEYEYDEMYPDDPYVWDMYPSAVFLAPIPDPEGRRPKARWSNDYQDEFPWHWDESTRPRGRLEEGLERIESGVSRAIEEDVPLVVAVTRVPDIAGHEWGKDPRTSRYIYDTCLMAERLCKQADEYMVVSDHGFDLQVQKGIEAHTRDATLASSFTKFSQMSDFIRGWHSDLYEVMNQQQLDALGYK